MRRAAVMRSLGIDVGVAKGLDLVLMDEARRTLERHRRVGLHSLEELIPAMRPDIVAIDSPPGWARRGGSRQTEREIRLFGIQSFGTPTHDRGIDHPFYEWMRVGFEAFRIAELCGFPRSGRRGVRGTAIEVFPHATAVILAGCVPPPAVSKSRWRAEVLAAHGVTMDGVRSADQVDAALAALTGIHVLAGRSCALGDPAEGVIVLPSRRLPARPYRRCEEGVHPEPQPHLPGLSPCRCGDPRCDRLTAREFAPGHDAKRKSSLWRAARAGQQAVDELRRRAWELPPEMR